MAISRRRFVIGFGALSLTSACKSQANVRDARSPAFHRLFLPAALQADLDAYQAFGRHRSGSGADVQTAEWISSRFRAEGYNVTWRPFEVDTYDDVSSELAIGETKHALAAQPPFFSAPTNRVEGRLTYLGPGGPTGPLKDRIVIADAPYDRPSSFASPAYRALADAALTQQARGLVLITNGPSGEAVWLNVDGEREYPLTALSAPKDAAPLRHAAIDQATGVLMTPLRQPKRTAYSLVASLARGPRQIVVSTPFSGWTQCAGERGPGIATLLALVPWLKQAKPSHSITFIATSGHELGDLGMRDVLAHAAPDPSTVDSWFHLGAGFAARDWYETPIGLVPMKSADPQRYLLASDTLRAQAAAAFQGLPGLETVHALSPSAAVGELKMIAEAGYQNAIGMFGAHRYHHTDRDHSETVSGDLVSPAASAVARLLQGTVSGTVA